MTQRLCLCMQWLSHALSLCLIQDSLLSSSSSRMSQLHPHDQLQQMSEPSLTMEEMQFWLDKAVAWGETDNADSQRDTCLHLNRLTAFIQQLLSHINTMVRYDNDFFTVLTSPGYTPNFPYSSHNMIIVHSEAFF